VTVLPDTSIWVELLREGKRGPAGELDRLLEEHSVLACGPVVAELLAGTPPERQEELWLLLSSLPWAELDAFGWREIGLVAGRLRRAGGSLPLTDVVIAVCAARARAVLWTGDEDFMRIAEVLPSLELYGEQRRTS
jgi:predicted nucleic acid-binding protein